MSLLTICNNAALECLQTANTFTSIVTNSDDSAQLFMRLSQRTGDGLKRRWGWVNTKVPGQIIGDGVTTLWARPGDWLTMSPSHRLVSSLYPLLPLIGPINQEDLLMMKALPAMPIRPVWRMIGGNIEIWPALALNEIVTLEYASSNWILDTDGQTRRATWTNDACISLISEDVIELGVIYRWKKAKGRAYAEDFAEFELLADQTAAQENASRIISMSNLQTGIDTIGTWPGIIINNSSSL